MNNYFKRDYPEINAIINDPEVKQFISNALGLFFQSIDMEKKKVEALTCEVFIKLKNFSSLYEYEYDVHKLIVTNSENNGVSRGLFERAEVAVDQVIPNLRKGKLLDYGCGDGLMASLIANKGYEVSLTDIYRHQKINERLLKFNLIGEKEVTGYPNEEFDNTLLYTVLHHAIDPIFTLKEAIRITKKGGVIIITESLFGADSFKEFKTNHNYLIELSKTFLNLTEIQQFEIDMFFDHLFNRCLFYTKDIYDKISVPYNYQTITGWEKIFKEKDLKIIKVINLGIDQRIAPLFHTMFVLGK